MPQNEASELADLAAPLLASQTRSKSAGRPAQPSGEFRYRIQVEEGDVQNCVDFSDADMPDELRPLVRWLTKRSE